MALQPARASLLSTAKTAGTPATFVFMTTAATSLHFAGIKPASLASTTSTHRIAAQNQKRLTPAWSYTAILNATLNCHSPPAAARAAAPRAAVRVDPANTSAGKSSSILSEIFSSSPTVRRVRSPALLQQGGHAFGPKQFLFAPSCAPSPQAPTRPRARRAPRPPICVSSAARIDAASCASSRRAPRCCADLRSVSSERKRGVRSRSARRHPTSSAPRSTPQPERHDSREHRRNSPKGGTVETLGDLTR